ncbi:hypothetical protein E2C01_022447 [Portunus trituberculatus]|uniref:Uncharacterized protein n=1 Tax=Portunus trituberculatus TaxID=210409 RepID=A0A5B7E7A7_PORTR|nr:hypothetical protein [Portunus trituberculatus]
MFARNGVGLEWDVRKWKSEMDKMVKCMGPSEWRNKIQQKSTSEGYKGKEAPVEQQSDRPKDPLKRLLFNISKQPLCLLPTLFRRCPELSILRPVSGEILGHCSIKIISLRS